MQLHYIEMFYPYILKGTHNVIFNVIGRKTFF